MRIFRNSRYVLKKIKIVNLGFPAYKESECMGPVMNGVCQGGVIDMNPMRERCYWIDLRVSVLDLNLKCSPMNFISTTGDMKLGQLSI